MFRTGQWGDSKCYKPDHGDGCICEYIKSHWIIHHKWAKCVLCKLSQ